MTQSSLLTQIMQRMRTRLMTFTPKGGGGTIGSRLRGQGIYIAAPPDNVSYPYAVLRLQNIRRSGEYDGMRMEGECEIVLYMRPRTAIGDVELIADFMQEAFLQWADVSQGLLVSRGDIRTTLPVGGRPEDRETWGVRILFDFFCWPRTMTQYVNNIS